MYTTVLIVIASLENIIVVVLSSGFKIYFIVAKTPGMSLRTTVVREPLHFGLKDLLKDKNYCLESASSKALNLKD